MPELYAIRHYAIRHRATGNILSQEWMKGGSYWEGELGKTGAAPRLFSLRGARGFIGAWVQGRFKRGTITPTFADPSADYKTFVSAEPCGRSRDDLEIVSVELPFLKAL